MFQVRETQPRQILSERRMFEKDEEVAPRNSRSSKASAGSQGQLDHCMNIPRVGLPVLSRSLSLLLMSISLYMCWLDSSLLQISLSASGSRNLGTDRFGPHFCWLPSPEKDWTAPLDLILFKSLETNMTGLSAIQSSHPLPSPSPPTFNLSQHQGLFQWVSSSHQVAKVMEFQLSTSVLPMIFRTDFL